jgi:crotonobetainyl-CoA:carnitine CoA-transferase CaiB-like acyl-CoA transferase
MPAIPADALPLKANKRLDMLEGTTVLDLSSSIAGPYAGQLLADLGARVIKVERPGRGDDCRTWGPPFLDGESLWYMSVNRNKEAVTLDFTTPDGRAVLEALIAKSDVVIVSLPIRTQEKLGIDYAAMATIRKDIIHVSITGFGTEGSRSDLACYDLIAEGYSGVMEMTGEPDNPPQKVGTPAADMLAGQDAAMAAVSAVVRHARTGQGARVDVTLAESMARFMAPRISPYLGSGQEFRRSGGRDSVIAIYQMFETATDPLNLGLGNDGIWQRFWTAVGEPDFASKAEYATNADRREHRPLLVTKIAAILAAKPRDEWLELFREARVPAGPIYRLDEIGRDEGFQERGLIYSVEREGTMLPQIGLGIHFDGHSEGCDKPSPRLGEDNQSVFGEWLGLDKARITELAKTGVI